MSLQAAKLQELAEKAVGEKGADGFYQLNDYHTNKLFEFMDPYVSKAAYRSNRFDHEDTKQEVFTEIFKFLRKHGIAYQGKSVHEIMKMKTQNTTNREYKKRTAVKRRINFPYENYEKIENAVDMPTCVAIDHPIFADNGKELRIHPTDGFFDMVALKEELSAYDKETLKELCGENAPQEEKQCNKDFAQNCFAYLSKATNPEKLNFLKSMINSIARTDLMLDAALTIIFEEITDRAYEKKYNPSKELNFHKKEIIMISAGNFIDISEALVGQQYVTPFMKKVEVVSKSHKRVKVLVIATNDQIDVPTNYKVCPLNSAIKNNSFPDFSMEEDINLEASENIEESNEAEELNTANVKVVENESSTSEEEAVHNEQTIAAKPKVRVEFAPEVVETIEESFVTEEVVAAETEVEAVKEPEVIEKMEEIDTSSTDAIETQEENPVNQKKAAKRTETAKALVIDLLSKKTHTKEELAKAIIDSKLTKNTELQKVIAYVSVMLSNLKNKNEVNLTSPERGSYRISK